MQLIPIGIIHSPFRQAQGTPVQPFSARDIRGSVEVFAPFLPGLKDLEGFERVWLLFWCDRASAAELLVTPYRDRVKRGLFATRAPARPNPIGISVVRLLEIRKNTLQVAELDILDGTPLLDIKPYVPQYDSYPTARCGWLDADNIDKGTLTADSRFEAGPQKPSS